MDYKNKVCVITGGALGIGRCLTREFSNVGAKVIFIDKNKEAGDENVEYIKRKGGEIEFFLGDIAEEDTLYKFAEFIIKKYKNIDYLINNACINKKGIISKCSYEDFNYVLKVGVTAPYILTQLLMNNFNKNGAIVNISSTRAYMSQFDTESYTAAKGGILALTHGLSVSLSNKVRVNSISPGWIDTGAYYDEEYVPKYSESDLLQHPSGRIGNPKDIARAAMFLCNEENSFINGENINIDGGMTKLMIYNDDNGWKYDNN
ncbi:SDR family oxidoreductase [Clostridium beijerinckii]|uniref:SDR family oxidoreductase n=1 Tax=Clostridium beijerinckii TaxID=1520 RepID=UPI001360C372|nr:SDR family oxidoreductase [Clostridium beijerinckii]MZK51475.1 SDR family oxidoreductase [Clostridium beijerinckii]MZK59750.1 SDR family oxidoreductase [Clostridium beijerinckii]MZK69967.1 SDR family oxidoreductase [Clostridium beijerinckii]MZK75269.1 SDR family oxidoreductase [Clostridium beijerinckii]MZK84885.1 SDR family oxidoreductase [Clostridium beijerinckii]